LEKNIAVCDIKDKTQLLVDKQSKKILSKISTFTLPLTSTLHSFVGESSVGCANCTDIKEHETSDYSCESGRDHYDESHPMFKSGKGMQRITIKKHNYQLRIGQ